ncbi:holin [Klebsiella pneumoniae]|uniref:holin n=1 Tax=Klebsiella pneumoniae TaxID=573 RepID=UPI0039868E7B
MTEGEKSVISLFIIGALIVVGKVLAGGEPITARLFIGRTLLGGFVSMVARALAWYSFQTCQPRPCADLAPCSGIAGLSGW